MVPSSIDTADDAREVTAARAAARPTYAGRSEGAILFLVALVQFVNTLDFMMVMPLGPDFASALGIPMARLGIIGGSYTAAAALSSLLAARRLDAFNRRSALACAIAGLVCATTAGAFAHDFTTLLAARIAAGLFGGPATALSLSIVADVVPEARRGRAMGAIMGALTAATMLGLPASLELARLFSWRAPFLSVAALGAVLSVAALVFMPPLRGHLVRRARPVSLLGFLRRRTMAMATLASLFTNIALYAVVPNASAYFQYNYGYPREGLSRLYLLSGLVSFACMVVAGRLVDKTSALRLAVLGTVVHVIAMAFGFWGDVPIGPPVVMFLAFTAGVAFRLVALVTLGSRLPEPHERAAYQSLQSAVQHVGASIGAVGSAAILRQGPGGKLLGTGPLAASCIVLVLFVPFLVHGIQRAMIRNHASLV